ncbi:MAG TPA: copper resistance protein B [Pseudoxanthomonas sp.]|nr:copper resistance protein B [Pseudoxanthomonas sp.]
MSRSSRLRQLGPMSVLACALAASSAWAAQDPHAGHSQHTGHGNMATTEPATPKATPAAIAPPREPIPAITDADRAAAFPAVDHHAMEHAPAITSLVLIDRLEGWQRDGHDGQAWEAQAWVGNDLNRVWLRTEGERNAGHTEAAQTELLYGRSVSPWWDVVAGVRHDTRPGDARSWAALGVQGLAPYKFEIAATAYLAEDGQIAATVEAEYELLLTNRLILQPRVEARLNGRDRVQFHESAGLSSLEAGLRLRYEVTRRFAPYVGISHGRHFGDGAQWDEDRGESSRETHYVVGVRLWF